MSPQSIVGILAILTLFVTPSAAAVLYVDATTGANSSACTSPATPCRTVTYAMTQAAAGTPGDQIDVAPGTYDLPLGETFPIVMKSGVRLRSTAGAERTSLDASGAGKRVLELLNANADTIVEGFTITGGDPVNDVTESPLLTVGGGMSINGGSPTIRKNVFLFNHARGRLMPTSDGGEGRGGGVYVTAATPTIVNNVFRGNGAHGGDGAGHSQFAFAGGPGNGGAIYFEGTGGTIANNTFYQNSAVGGTGSSNVQGTPAAPGGMGNFGAVHSNGPGVSNNIFANNTANGGAGSVRGLASFGALQANNPSTPISNNFFFGNTVNGAPSTGDTVGTASVCYEPQQCSGVFFHGEPSNLRISPNSLAAWAGTATGAPADDFEGVTRPNPPSIGAFEPSVAGNPVRLVNIATRAQVLTGDDVMIGGFVIGGPVVKTVVVRARGPSLAAQGVPGVLANPQLQLFPSGYTNQIGYNDNWQDASNAAALQASGFAPANALESALLVTLSPQAYTVIVTGVGNTAGVGIFEVFEVDRPTNPLINIATRARVLTGDNVMIAGFIIEGTGPQSVVVRARGPSLTQFGVPGVLANPTLDLYSGQTVIASNDDWQQATNAAQLRATGFAPFDPAESAILVTLQPGAYTAIVSGVGGTSGVAIVEVFKN